MKGVSNQINKQDTKLVFAASLVAHACTRLVLKSHGNYRWLTLRQLKSTAVRFRTGDQRRNKEHSDSRVVTLRKAYEAVYYEGHRKKSNLTREHVTE